LTKNLTFLTVAPMVDRRPRMRRSHWNATVLLFTCLIRRMSDGSRMNSLFLAVGCLGFLYKNSQHLSFVTATAALSPAYSILPSPTLRKNNGGESRKKQGSSPCSRSEFPSSPRLALHQLSSSCSSRSIMFRGI
jgi:hypothetical protein